MSRIYLTYDNKSLQDGFFAQTQRILAIISLAKFLKFDYLHSPILDLTITQLDEFQSEQEVAKFLEKSEKIFNFPPHDSKPTFSAIYNFGIPKITDLLLIKIKYFFSKKNVLVKIVNPYRIIEKFPSIYNVTQSVQNEFNTGNSQKHQMIVAHVRRGINIHHVTPGENSERILDENYFIDLIRKIIRVNPRITELIILTDAPENDFFYKPIAKDNDKWEEFNYLKSSDGVLIQGHRFEQIIASFPGSTTIIRGGDIFQALELIRSADYFLMSRSSMSFVGALLNKSGVIYYPPNFWHKPLKNWIKCS